MCKKPCKECPWVNTNQHSLNFRTYVEKMKSIGVKKHACHMISADIWGYNSEINDKNKCAGQNKFNK